MAWGKKKVAHYDYEAFLGCNRVRLIHDIVRHRL